MISLVDHVYVCISWFDMLIILIGKRSLLQTSVPLIHPMKTPWMICRLDVTYSRLFDTGIISL